MTNLYYRMDDESSMPTDGSDTKPEEGTKMCACKEGCECKADGTCAC